MPRSATNCGAVIRPHPHQDHRHLQSRHRLLVPANLTVAGGFLYFSATDSTLGTELWRFNGFSVTRVDVNPTAVSSNPDNMAVFNGLLYFSGTQGSFGAELMRLNADLTVTRIMDIAAGNGSSSPQSLTVHDNILYFSATDGLLGRELWSYNGANVTRLTDLNAGSLSATPPISSASATPFTSPPSTRTPSGSSSGAMTAPSARRRLQSRPCVLLACRTRDLRRVPLCPRRGPEPGCRAPPLQRASRNRPSDRGAPCRAHRQPSRLRPMPTSSRSARTAPPPKAPPSTSPLRSGIRIP